MNEFARILRKDATDAERLLWSRLRLRRIDGFRFRRRKPVGNYICDFVCMQPRLIIELDGSQHVEHSAYDARRDATLRPYGFRVLRFWNSDVLTRMENVLETIYEALHRPGMDGRYD